MAPEASGSFAEIALAEDVSEALLEVASPEGVRVRFFASPSAAYLVELVWS